MASARLPSGSSAVKCAGVPVGVSAVALGAMVGASGAVVGAVARKLTAEVGSEVAVNEITVPLRLTLWQPAQVSGLVGDDGTMNGEAREAPNGSR